MNGKILKITPKEWKGQLNRFSLILVDLGNNNHRQYSCWQPERLNLKEGQDIEFREEIKSSPNINPETGEPYKNYSMILPSQPKPKFMSRSIQEVKSIEQQVCLKAATDAAVALICQDKLNKDEVPQFILGLFGQFVNKMPNGHADENQQQ